MADFPKHLKAKSGTMCKPKYKIKVGIQQGEEAIWKSGQEVKKMGEKPSFTLLNLEETDVQNRCYAKGCMKGRGPTPSFQRPNPFSKH